MGPRDFQNHRTNQKTLISATIMRPKWEDRIKLIVEEAPQWDVGTICSVPAWVQIVLEKVIKHHKVTNIHDIWPNVNVYTHWGVSIEPNRESFQKLWEKPVRFIETCMASEGSLHYRTSQRYQSASGNLPCAFNSKAGDAIQIIFRRLRPPARTGLSCI